MKEMTWEEHSKWESNWHGTCQNTLGEELKQLRYAELMGLKLFSDSKSPFNIDMSGQSVLDMGGGPISLLLKCCNVLGTIIDPCDYPEWVSQRYVTAGIELIKCKGEDYKAEGIFDLGLCYNVLQHVVNPELVIRNMRYSCKEIRIFEWLENGVSPGHPNNLTELELNGWLGGEGKVRLLTEPTLKGKCYSGIFMGGL